MMTRLAYLSNSTVPSRAANTVQVMKMCDAFASNCDHVTLYCKAGDEVNSSDLYDDYGIENPFEIRSIYEPDVFASSLYYGLRTALSALREGADIAYGRSITACFFAARLGLPVVYEVHQPTHEHWAYRWMFRRLVNDENFLRLIAISGQLGIHYDEHFDLPEVVVAHDCADDPPDVDPYFERSETVRVGYIGQLHEGKGMELIAKLVRRCEWAEFHVIGGMDEDIERWQSELDDVNNMTFHGYVPYAETHRYRQSIDIALAPYQREVYGAGEGDVNLGRWMSPLKIFEYMAAGSTIAASDLPVLREVLVDGENAMLCDPASVDEWVRTLEHLRDNPEERQRLGKNARDDYEARYTWQRRSERVLSGLI